MTEHQIPRSLPVRIGAYPNGDPSIKIGGTEIAGIVLDKSVSITRDPDFPSWNVTLTLWVENKDFTADLGALRAALVDALEGAETL